MSNTYTSPIIDREVLFGNPVISGGQISPDGQYISFIKPNKGVMNIWVKRIDDSFDKAIPLTEDLKRPVTSYFWSRDSQYILYVQDKGGDENYHLYAVDPSAAKKDAVPPSKDLSDYGDIRAMIYSLPRSNPKVINLGINDRDKAWHDCYEINLETGKRTLIYKNVSQLNGFTFDQKGQLRLATRSTPDGGSELLDLSIQEPKKLLYANLEESFNPIKFHNDGRLYYSSNIGEPDFEGLYLYDFNSKQGILVESDPEAKVDLANVSFSEVTQELIATIYVGDKKRIYWKDKTHEDNYNYLQSQFPEAEISITSTTKDEQKMLIYVNGDTDPGKAYLYDKTQNVLTHIYTPRPDLPTQHLAPMNPVSYPSLDGLTIPAYLTLPTTDEKKQLPAILFIHGGPWARDYWGYNSFAQFLANRGYAVLQINFRGSTGYGKKFLNAAINQWGEKMQDDLTAGAQYLIKEGIADPEKIAIAGGSYGGYATLAGLTFTPDIYAAGVSIVGPSNLFTLLDTIPPYWESARVMFHKRMGDPNTPEGKAQLRRQSPFFHAKNIRAPLMVAQGNNDPRVKTSESDQIVIAMRDLNLPVKYINFPDEGHGFANPDNNMAFLAAMETFLAEHLGGRYQESLTKKTKEILKKVTVDINQLKMPEIVSDDMLTAALPIPTAHISEGTYYYRLSINMKGQQMAHKVKRTIFSKDETWVISDKSEMFNDHTKVLQNSLAPLSRDIEQGLVRMSYSVEPKEPKGVAIIGTMTVQGNEQAINLALDIDILMDGPSLDVFISLLPLDTNYSTTLRVLDSNSQKVYTSSLKVVAMEKIQAQSCYKCVLKSIDGAAKEQTYWILKSEAPFMIKKHSIIAEMGGAEVTMDFLRSGPVSIDEVVV